MKISSSNKQSLSVPQSVLRFRQYAESLLGEFLGRAAVACIDPQVFYEENWLNYFGRLSERARYLVAEYDMDHLPSGELRDQLQEICENGLKQLYEQLYKRSGSSNTNAAS